MLSLTTAQASPAAPCVRRLPACETDIRVGFSPPGALPQGIISSPLGRANSPYARRHFLCLENLRIDQLPYCHKGINLIS